MTQNAYYIIDFDSTFITCEVLEELAKISLQNNPKRKEILEEIVFMCNLGMEGKIPFQESLQRRLQLIKVHKNHLRTLIQTLKKKITPSIIKNRQFFLDNYLNIYIISGAFKECIIPITRPFGIDNSHILANTFIYDAKGNITDIDSTNRLAYKHGKAKAVDSLHLKGKIYVLGDGYTDYEIKKFGAANYFFAFTENIRRENVVKNADCVVKNFDEFLELINGKASTHKYKLKALLLEGIDQIAVDLLTKKSVEIEYMHRALSEDELCNKIADVDILGVRTRTYISRKALSYANKLRCIGAFCTGIEHINISAANKKNIEVFYAPFGSTRSVVELVIGSIIMLFRNVHDKSRKMHEGIWDKSSEGNNEIRGKTLGIVGYGHIGTSLSVVAEALGMKVVFFDIIDKLPYGNAKNCRSLDELLKISDVISIHVDGRKENTNLIGEREFQKMKDRVLFINTSRGHVVDYTLLTKYIKNGKVKGAAIDVFINSPMARGEPFSSPLQNLPNVILTPHLGGSTEEAQRGRGEFVAQKIIDFLDSSHPQGD